MQIITPRSRVVAVLGPTNTGKTHLAMERMLAHASGMIGFPLRLLARENYDRAVRIKGAGSVALITGEEKIVPLGARYFLCTVESMPVEREVAFLGVDEIQMCADPDRGHVFTERLLGARGSEETMLMGADTIRPLIRRLVPEAEFVSRPRFSTLIHTGGGKTTRLPKRSAIVAFSAADVYAIAELIRRQRGGAAVVMGALSPRTRNAQVAMYQDGEVDYLVATDAIGMGLNMDVNHVAFAGLRKFDGRAWRDLTAPELAQVAGRAGRHMNDGTFGTTAEAGALDPEIAARIENHEFDPLREIYWRNPHLRFDSLDALKASLDERPTETGLVRARPADDEVVLEHLAREPGIVRLAAGADAVETLWEVCRIPDFGRVMSDAHARLLGVVYRHLTGPAGRLPTDWMAAQVARLDRTDGDIETLTQRIAGTRTWTYVSFRADWVDDARHWQERTRLIEDRLSDALHERLTQRFVDKRTALLVSRMKDRPELLAAVTAAGEVLVEGHHVGRLEAFRFVPDSGGEADFGTAAARSVSNAAGKALRGEIETRVRACERAPDTAFALVESETGLTGEIAWDGVAIARLAASPNLLKPDVELGTAELLEPDGRDRVLGRLRGWLERRIGTVMEALFAATAADLSGPARGIVFRLSETLGSMPRRTALPEIGALNRNARRRLGQAGVRIGRESVYLPAMVKPAQLRLRALLFGVHGRHPLPVPLPEPGRVAVPVDADMPRGYYEAVGYRPLGRLAVRVDMLERLAGKAWSLARSGPFALGPELLTMAGVGADDMSAILKRLGYRATLKGGVELYRPGPRNRTRRRLKTGADTAPGPAADSPFARLKDLAVGR